MAGRFEGLSDLEWRLFEDIFLKEPEKHDRGMPHAPFRYILNTLLYILITGCRWCDVPRGEIWASKSAAHRWLKRWQADGTLENLQERVSIPIVNTRYQQTYYDGLDYKTKEFFTYLAKKSDLENTIQFLEDLRSQRPGAKLLIIWDGAILPLFTTNKRLFRFIK